MNIGGSSIMKLQNTDAKIVNSLFKNMGWTYIVNPYILTNTDWIKLFYFWTCDNVILENNIIINEGRYSLFTGFVHCMYVNNITLFRNSFHVYHKIPLLFYMGVIICNSPITIVKDNIFYNFECPIFPDMIHGYGAFTAQGENSFSKTNNGKIAIFINNIFDNCSCKNGGSLGIINYQYLTIENLTILNSKATNYGGAGFIICSSIMSLKNLLTYNVSSDSSGSIIFMKNIDIINIENATSENSLSKLKGGFYMKYVEKITLNWIISINSYGAESHMSNLFFTNSKAGNNGGVIYLTEIGNISIFNLKSNFSSGKMGGFLYIDSSFIINLTQIEISNAYSIKQGEALFIDIVLLFNILLMNLIECETSNSGIIYFENVESIPSYFINNLNCIGNSAIFGSCIFADTQGDLMLNNLICEKTINASIYMSSISSMTITLTNCSFYNSSSDDYFIYIGNVITFIQNIYLYNCQSSSLYLWLKIVIILLSII